MPHILISIYARNRNKDMLHNRKHEHKQKLCSRHGHTFLCLFSFVSMIGKHCPQHVLKTATIDTCNLKLFWTTRSYSMVDKMLDLYYRYPHALQNSIFNTPFIRVDWYLNAGVAFRNLRLTLCVCVRCICLIIFFGVVWFSEFKMWEWIESFSSS